MCVVSSYYVILAGYAFAVAVVAILYQLVKIFMLHLRIYSSVHDQNSFYCAGPVGGSVRALTRSRNLLLRYLTPAQKETFVRYSYFDAFSPGGRHFRIMPCVSQNVVELDASGNWYARYCNCLDDNRLPLYDMMLTQKIVIEADINQFFKTAEIVARYREC